MNQSNALVASQLTSYNSIGSSLTTIEEMQVEESVNFQIQEFNQLGPIVMVRCGCGAASRRSKTTTAARAYVPQPFV
jgi:hypothetical protein